MALCLASQSYSAPSLLRGKHYYESIVNTFYLFLYIYLQIYASTDNTPGVKLWPIE